MWVSASNDFVKMFYHLSGLNRKARFFTTLAEIGRCSFSFANGRIWTCLVI